MADWTKITDEQFDAAYNNHLPSAWIKFAFRYFSKTTEKKDMSVSRTVLYILLGAFGVGYIGTILTLPRIVIGIATYILGIILAGLVLYLFSAAKLNNWRLNKIAKELGVTKREYDWLAEKFYDN